MRQKHEQHQQSILERQERHAEWQSETLKALQAANETANKHYELMTDFVKVQAGMVGEHLRIERERQDDRAGTRRQREDEGDSRRRETRREREDDKREDSRRRREDGEDSKREEHKKRHRR